MKKRNLLFEYIFEHRCFLGMFACFSVVFALVFSLYDLKFSAVAYSIVLCMFFSVVVFAFKFISFVKQHREREILIKNIILMDQDLPEPKTLAEKDYQKMINKLKEINFQTINKYEHQRAEGIDYYTTWVHQIKTPISVMQMILRENDTNENRELLEQLFKIEQYVEMVLCYFRLDSSSSDFVIKEYDLDEIIKVCIRKYASQFVRKKIKLEYEGTDKSVLTDKKWLSFIIEQLLSNAIKYTETGKVTIEVSDDKILKISDTGMGIASEDLPRIFEKGFTGLNGRNDKKSTGLGLYISKCIADKLSHKITAESQIGKGSCFSIDLNTDEIEIE